MLISKQQGEKLCVKELKQVYGGCDCAGNCASCDCTSREENYFSNLNCAFQERESILVIPAQH